MSTQYDIPLIWSQCGLTILSKAFLKVCLSLYMSLFTNGRPTSRQLSYRIDAPANWMEAMEIHIIRSVYQLKFHYQLKNKSSTSMSHSR